MPYGDRTGPRGRGSRTVRCLGFYTGYHAPGYPSRGGDFASARYPCRNAGGGWGYRHWSYATGLPGWMRAARDFTRVHWGTQVSDHAVSRAEEMELLKDEAVYFEEALVLIRERIAKLESFPETDKKGQEADHAQG